MRRFWGIGAGLLVVLVYAGGAMGQTLNLTQTYPDAEGSFFNFTYTYSNGVGKFSITSTDFSAWYTTASSHVSISSGTFDMTAYLQVVGGQVSPIPQASLPQGDTDSLLVKGTPSGGNPTDYIDSTNLFAFGTGPGDTNAGADFEFAWRQDSNGTAFPTGWAIGAIIFGPTNESGSSNAPIFTENFASGDSIDDQMNVFPEPSSGVLMLVSVFGIARRRRRA
jgi:hypothetical protein